MNAVTIRYNSSGTAQWTQTWDNAGLTDACGTIAINTGSSVVIVTGFSQTNATTWEYAALRYDQSTGNPLGSYVTNQGGTTIDLVNAAALDNSGNIYLTGAMGASGQQLNIKTIKLDATLNILWTATYNGAANKDDVGRGIAVDASGNVYVAGYTTGDDRDAVMLKYTSGGSQSWAQVYDAAEGDDEYADLALTAGGEPFVGGYVTQKGNKDFFAALYNSSGSVRWSESHNGLYNKNDAIQQVTPDGTGNFLVAGPSGQNNAAQAVMTIKYALHTLVKPQNEEVNTPFTENRGQTLDTDDEPEDNIRYYTRSMYPNVYIFDDKVSYVFAHIDTVPASEDTMARLDLSFVPTSAQVQNGRTQVAVGLERQDAFHNYYLGHIPEGRERVPLENKVLQPAIYTNIDALYGQGQDGLFIRFICKPGSNPANIKLAFSGQTALSVQTDGSLKVETALEDLVLPRPTAMTVSEEGTETAITAWQPAYSISSGIVSLTLGSYDTLKTLVVKTGREREDEEAPCNQYWSTYFGDISNDVALGNDTRTNGDMYYTGKTRSTLFPVTPGAFQEQLYGVMDAYAACFQQPDVQKWLTFYGGNDSEGFPEDIEVGYAIKWNPSNNMLYFVGRTSCADFPLKDEGGYYNASKYSTNPSDWYSRGFIVKLAADNGAQQWATFFGDSHRQQEGVVCLAILENGNIMVGGFSYRNEDYSDSAFPTTASGSMHSQNSGSAYVAEFGLNNNLIWATKLANEINADLIHSYPHGVYDITGDGNGNIFLTGLIEGNDTGTPGDYIPLGANTFAYKEKTDLFIMKFSPEREMLWSTFFGGKQYDWPNSIVCKNNGDVIVTGTTQSNESTHQFPVKEEGNASNLLLNDITYNGGITDIFISKFDNNGVQKWARYLGGPGRDEQGILWAEEAYNVLYGVGNSAKMDDATLYVTGWVENNFAPLAGLSDCLHYYPVINGFSSTSEPGYTSTGSDAFLTVIDPNQYITFSTYWGGSGVNVGSVNFDRGFTVTTGVNPFNNKQFVLFGGATSSGKVIQSNKKRFQYVKSHLPCRTITIMT